MGGGGKGQLLKSFYFRKLTLTFGFLFIQCTWTAARLANVTGFEYTNEVMVSFLPLSHIAAQMLDIVIPLKYAFSVYFAQPDALKVRSLYAI